VRNVGCKDYSWLKLTLPEVYDKEIKWIQNKKCEEKANKFRLENFGFIEKVLGDKKYSKIREQLVYKNFYYGKYKKHKIKINVIVTSSSPSHFRFPELYGWLEKRVKMDVEIWRHLKNKTTLKI
jgi:hypothetical protein